MKRTLLVIIVLFWHISTVAAQKQASIEACIKLAVASKAKSVDCTISTKSEMLYQDYTYDGLFFLYMGKKNFFNNPQDTYHSWIVIDQKNNQIVSKVSLDLIEQLNTWLLRLEYFGSIQYQQLSQMVFDDILVLDYPSDIIDSQPSQKGEYTLLFGETDFHHLLLIQRDGNDVGCISYKKKL